MENNPLSLSILIEEGKEIKKQITRIPNPPGFISSYIDYKIADLSKYERWKYTVIRFLTSKYNGDRCIKDFEDTLEKFQKHNNPKYFEELIGILASCEVIPIIPRVQSSSKGGNLFNINLTQKQTQTQEQSQIMEIFVDAIKDEISGKQLKELQNIIKEDGNTEKARTKIVDKIKSWGENIMASIIANVITNPTVVNGIIG